MKRLALFIVVVFFAGIKSNAQDTIIFIDGNEVVAKVTEVSDTDVKYVKWNNINGPTWVKKVDDIFMIRYANGTKQIFTVISKSANKPQRQESSKTRIPPKKIVEPDTNVARISLPTTLFGGLNVRWGYNGMLYGLYNSSIGSEWEFWNLSRCPFSFGLYADLLVGQKVKVKKDSSWIRLGVSLGLLYTKRGGTNSEMYYSSPATFDFSYFCIRPAFTLRSCNKRNVNYVWRIGYDVGILMDANLSAGGKNGSLMDSANPVAGGIFSELNFCFGHLFLGLWGELMASTIIKPEAMAMEDLVTLNYAIGVSIGVELGGIKIGKK